MHVSFSRNWLGQRAQPTQPTPCLSDDQPYSPGDLICDDYVVRVGLGRGGMGEVYLVEHASSGELRAAKVMRARATATAVEVAGFRHEALALLNVGAHPFFVQLLE